MHAPHLSFSRPVNTLYAMYAVDALQQSVNWVGWAHNHLSPAACVPRPIQGPYRLSDAMRNNALRGMGVALRVSPARAGHLIFGTGGYSDTPACALQWKRFALTQEAETQRSAHLQQRLDDWVSSPCIGGLSGIALTATFAASMLVAAQAAWLVGAVCGSVVWAAKLVWTRNPAGFVQSICASGDSVAAIAGAVAGVMASVQLWAPLQVARLAAVAADVPVALLGATIGATVGVGLWSATILRAKTCCFFR